jgi:hypothetical protein
MISTIFITILSFQLRVPRKVVLLLGVEYLLLTLMILRMKVAAVVIMTN